MPTDDPRAAAIEAFKAAWEEADRRGEKGHRTEAGMAAAVPHLTAGLRALADHLDARAKVGPCSGTNCAGCALGYAADEIRTALDALERGGEQ